MKQRSKLFIHFATQSIDKVLKELDVTEKGLSAEEVKKRQKKYGLNEIKEKKVTWLLILKRQLSSPFIYVFFAATEINAVTVPLNIHWKEKELRYYVNKCGIQTVITHSDLLSQWGDIPSQEKKIKFVLCFVPCLLLIFTTYIF